jgi:hypothetical protein
MDAVAVASKKKKLDKKTSSVTGPAESEVEKEATKKKKKKPDKEEKKEAKNIPKLAKKPEKTPAKKTTGTAKPKTTGSGARGRSAIEVWSGKPDEPLPGGWPDGWTKKIFERPSGKTKGSHDRYWYTPVTKRKFRSMVEVNRFMAALLQSKGDEDAAWAIFKK